MLIGGAKLCNETLVQQYHNFGDLIRLALGRCREANPLAWYRTVLLSLQQPFLTLREEGDIDLTSTQWADLKVCMYWPRSLSPCYSFLYDKAMEWIHDCTRKEATCLLSVTTRFFFFCRTWLGNMLLALALTVTIHTKSGSLLWASTGVCLYSQ